MGLLGTAVESSKRSAARSRSSQPELKRARILQDAEVALQRRATEQQRGMQLFPRGPNTLEDLFLWPCKVANKIKASPKLYANWSRNLNHGVIVYSDHSGCGSGEEGLRDVMLASDVQHADWSPLLYSAVDPCSWAQEALTATSAAKHLFNKVESQVLPGKMKEVQHLIPCEKDSLEKCREKLAGLREILQREGADFFPDGRTSWCVRKSKAVPVRARKPAGSLDVLLSGTECQGFSAMNKTARGSSAVNFSTFLFWVFQIPSDPFDLVLHENVMRFQPGLLHDYLGDLRLGSDCSRLYSLRKDVRAP